MYPERSQDQSPDQDDFEITSPYQDEPDWDEGDFTDVIDDPNRESEFPETD